MTHLYALGQTALEVAEHSGIGKTTVVKIPKAVGVEAGDETGPTPS